jgi:hypothetical protein
MTKNELIAAMITSCDVVFDAIEDCRISSRVLEYETEIVYQVNPKNEIISIALPDDEEVTGYQFLWMTYDGVYGGHDSLEHAGEQMAGHLRELGFTQSAGPAESPLGCAWIDLLFANVDPELKEHLLETLGAEELANTFCIDLEDHFEF